VSQLITLFEIHDPQRATVPEEFDQVCRMRLEPESAPARLPYGERLYYFCSFNCAQKFARSPENYVKS
jgi:YHS domain-containing protein